MTYQVLARKWRPQDFSAIIGQESIVTALRNALREGRIAQAYLFAGIRGVGKTTAARVLAKALNCERGPAEDPCNECATCLGITSGSDLDVLEIDAATYSKVEQVRELTESLRYGPANDRYKVVVLDEVHRLSRAAFDALLRVGEEPPPHATFIFATTEIDAVPATILSRCQEFHFRRVPVATLAEHLRSLCEAEEIEASDTALRLIARAGEGSVRDAVALLDQLATFGNGAIADEDATRLLGGLDIQLFERTLRAILDGDRGAIQQIVSEIEDRGWDPRSAFAHLLSYCRDGLHLIASAEGEVSRTVELPEDAASRLRELAVEAGFESLLRLLHLLLGSELIIKRSELPGLALEVALLRAAELPRVRSLEEIVGSPGPPISDSGDATRSSPGPGSAGRSSAKRPAGPDGRSAGAPAEAPLPEHGDTAPGDEESAPPVDTVVARRAFIDHLRGKPSLAAHLDEVEIAVEAKASGLLVRVLVQADDQVAHDLFSHHLAFLEDGAARCTGSATRCSVERALPSPPRAEAGRPDDHEPDAVGTASRGDRQRRPRADAADGRGQGPESRAESHDAGARGSGDGETPRDRLALDPPPVVQAVLEVFPGEVVAALPRGGEAGGDAHSEAAASTEAGSGGR